MNTPSYPVVRLRPKAQPRAIRHGFPWVYDNELVTDRRARGLEPGSFAVLEDADRAPLALVTVNPNSRIMARVIDRDPAAMIDRIGLRRNFPALWPCARGFMMRPSTVWSMPRRMDCPDW
jgi:23S rRNA (cytosine1962-C5)-methyltransferase